jgi:hypothetical protein
LSKTSIPRNARLRLVGVAIFAAFVAAIFVFGLPTQAHFSTEHKMQIQRIANELCAAAAEHPCQLSWGGKSKWFGTLEPSAPGRGKVGLDQVRQVLTNTALAGERSS